MIPSNSLAAVYGIAADCAERQVLGPDVAIAIEVIDETNTRVDVPELLARFRSNGNFGMVALVGVQSNQYPRALDIARPFRAAGIPVAMGGFHVSGCLSMLDGRAVELDACRDLGISMFAGEAEGRLEHVVAGRRRRTSRAALQFHERPAGMRRHAGAVPAQAICRSGRSALSTSFDAGRGCPYQCSFCTIINVQGRKSRFRSADDVEHLVRLNWAQGIHKFFITDDNFARNKEWESIFDRLIELRERGRNPARPDDPGRYVVPQDPEFHREGEARRRHARVHRPRERQSGQPRRRQEAAEQDHRIPKDAAGLEGAGHHHACGLHPGLPVGHAGDHPARHRDHSGGAAARHHRVLLPDAAAGLGGPSGSLEKRRRDGPGPQQVRRRARLHRASAHEPGAVGGDLSRSLVASITRRSTWRRCCAARWRPAYRSTA